MKFLVSFILLIVPFGSLAADNFRLSDLDELRWKNRVILIFSDDVDRLKKQLEESSDEIMDRDIIWFIVSNSRIITNYHGSFSEDFISKIKKEHLIIDNNVVLIGKDGGIKARDSHLNLTELFQKIDSMPMRIDEMKQKSVSSKSI